MFGSEILDVAIGLIFVYLLLSLIASAVREGIEAWLKTRAIHLERGIRELLHGNTQLTRDLYSHPLISSLYRGSYDASKIGSDGLMPRKSDLPSYIPSKNFAVAMLDLVVRGRDVTSAAAAEGTAPLISLESVRERVSTIQEPHVQRALLSAIDTAQGDLNAAQANIEAWFNGSMDRVSGWYKRESHKVLLIIGIFTALLVNADTIAIARKLYRDPSTRAVVVAQAAEYTRQQAQANGSGQLQGDSANVQALYSRVNGLGLPIGWSGVRYAPEWNDSLSGFWSALLAPLFGWLITGLAISLGAPFWFDTLNRIMVIRSTVKPHEKSPEEASEDRQAPQPRTVQMVAPGQGAGQGGGAGGGAGGGQGGAPPGGGESDSFVPHEWAEGSPEEGIL